MTTNSRLAFAVSAAGLLFGLVLSSASFAQDAMQLDTMFRESLSRGHDFQQKREEEGRRAQGRRHEERDADQRQDAERRKAQKRSEGGR
jgi:pentapeptide MXKDX repeat protein